jgi:hypothetical protein
VTSFWAPPVLDRWHCTGTPRNRPAPLDTHPVSVSLRMRGSEEQEKNGALADNTRAHARGRVRGRSQREMKVAAPDAFLGR